MPIVGAVIPLLALGLLGWLLVVVGVIWSIVALGIVIKYLLLWRAARLIEAPLTLGEIIAMRRRKVDPRVIIHGFGAAKEAQLDLTVNQIERHVSHGGRAMQVIEALTLAQSEKVRATWTELCRRDLNSKDVLRSIQKRVEEARDTRRKRARHQERSRSRRRRAESSDQ